MSATHTPEKRSRPRTPVETPFDQMPHLGLSVIGVVSDVSGLKPSEIHERVAEGRFPKPLKLGPRCSRWRACDIREWLADPVNWNATTHSTKGGDHE